jgi:hypothetical protein
MHVKEVVFVGGWNGLSFIYLILHDNWIELNWTTHIHSYDTFIITIYMCVCVCCVCRESTILLQKVSLVRTQWNVNSGTFGRKQSHNLSTWKEKIQSTTQLVMILNLYIYIIYLLFFKNSYFSSFAFFGFG